MFSLDKKQATLDNLNLRAERHGDETVSAADLKISLQAANLSLDAFDPALRRAFWRRPGAGEQAELIDDDNHLTVLRFPKIKTIKYEHELKGCAVEIEYGLGGVSNIRLDGCDVDKFTFDPLEGGSVNVAFRVKCQPSGDQVARLYELIQDDIVITITPPEPGSLVEGEDEDDEETADA